MKIKTAFLGLVICLTISGLSCASKKDNPVATPPESLITWNAKANEAQKELWSVYWNSSNGRFNSTETGGADLNYWWQAHALDVLVDLGIRSDTADAISKISYLYGGVNTANNGFINDYYDDMEWMALANLRAFYLTNSSKYVNTSIALWNNIILGWNTSAASGGICWRKNQTDYKNTPANAPAAILAARLYSATKDEAYLDWSIKIYNWLNSTLVDPTTGIVWDGINRNKDGAIDKSWLFTYNQGIYIGASVELYKITKDAKYLANANKTMSAVMSKMLVPSTNVLQTEGTGDGGLFKGILVRYLTNLILLPDIDATLKKKYIDFLTANANSLWNKAKRPSQAIFNNDWTVAPTNTNLDLATQLSAVMLLESMATLENKNLFSGN